MIDMTNKVMIVDDDSHVQFAVRKLFEFEGFEVFTVSTGEACLEELENGFKGVILMDIMMPGMDGWDTIKEIVNRGFAKENIIAMLTARELSEQKKMNDFKDYVVDFIEKPFDPEKLIKTVNGYFDRLQKS